MATGKVNPSSTAPSTHQSVISFSDSVNLDPGPTRAIILSAAATLSYVDAEGNSVTFDFPAGQFSISLIRINSTGTTATAGSVLGLF